MRIILYEVRKAFHWKILVLLALLALIMYQLFIGFYFEYFPNERPESDVYRVGVDLVKAYGTDMDEHEYARFKATYEEDVKAADRYIQTREEFASAGIKNYEDFRNLNSDSSEQAQKLHGTVLLEDEVDLFWKLQAEEYWIERYDNRSKTLYGNDNSASSVPGQTERLQEAIASKDRLSMLPYLVFNNYTALIHYMPMLLFLSVIVLTGPVYLRDRRNGMINVQYATRTGRRLLSKKWPPHCFAPSSL